MKCFTKVQRISRPTNLFPFAFPSNPTIYMKTKTLWNTQGSTGTPRQNKTGNQRLYLFLRTMDVQKCVNFQMYHFNIEKRLSGVGEALDLIFLCLVILSYRLCDIFSFHF